MAEKCLQWQDFRDNVKIAFGNLKEDTDFTDVTLRRLYVCKVCGKEGQSTNVQRHIEAQHLEGPLLPCNVCGKTSKSRNELSKHKSRDHRIV